MGASREESNAAVSRAIAQVNNALKKSLVLFEKLRSNAAGDEQALEDTRALERSFVETVQKITAQVRYDYDQGEITAEEAIFFLNRSDEVVYRVMNQSDVFQALFDTGEVGRRAVNMDKFKAKLAYKKAGQHAIMGLITTLAIVGAVVVALALAGPSLGASLFFLLPLALSGAGCGIPSALEGRRWHLKSESPEAEIQDIVENKISGYAKDLKKAYAVLRPDDDTSEPSDGEENKNSL
ncbi:MAG: hypothetical protein GW760_01350 [Legionella sp.]|nr:hypothetical protein [Legionella sp.]